MNFYLSLPLLFLRFFFYDLPVSVMSYFGSVNKAFLQISSLPLLFRTFFKPWKNEYRKEFIPVAIGIGMGVKTFVILADLIMLFIILLVESLFILGIMCWPFITIVFLFK